MEECCGNCRFYKPEGRECRRFPPTEPSLANAFPWVHEHEWCGEYAPKTPENSDQIIDTQSSSENKENPISKGPYNEMYHIY